MSRARIIIEHNGKTYRVGRSHRCASKRDCDLFKRGVCDSASDAVTPPCDAIADAFIASCGICPKYGYREVRT